MPSRTSVTERAIEQIKTKIASGQLHPGQRLPTEREPAAAAVAAARMTETNLASLRAEMVAMEHGLSVEQIVGHDLQFHRIITEAAGNPVLSAIFDGLNNRTAGHIGAVADWLRRQTDANAHASTTGAPP